MMENTLIIDENGNTYLIYTKNWRAVGKYFSDHQIDNFGSIVMRRCKRRPLSSRDRRIELVYRLDDRYRVELRECNDRMWNMLVLGGNPDNYPLVDVQTNLADWLMDRDFYGIRDDDIKFKQSLGKNLFKKR